MSSLDRAAEVMDQLRSPGGCPWDAAQTHLTLARYLLEETYETLEAIETGDSALLREELGDLLLQVLFHARLAEELPSGQRFSIEDVAGDLVDKLIRRHPHVFDSPGGGSIGHGRGQRVLGAPQDRREGPHVGRGRRPGRSAGTGAGREAGRAGRPGRPRCRTGRDRRDRRPGCWPWSVTPSLPASTPRPPCGAPPGPTGRRSWMPRHSSGRDRLTGSSAGQRGRASARG